MRRVPSCPQARLHEQELEKAQRETVDETDAAQAAAAAVQEAADIVLAETQARLAAAQARSHEHLSNTCEQRAARAGRERCPPTSKVSCGVLVGGCAHHGAGNTAHQACLLLAGSLCSHTYCGQQVCQRKCPGTFAHGHSAAHRRRCTRRSGAARPRWRQLGSALQRHGSGILSISKRRRRVTFGLLPFGHVRCECRDCAAGYHPHIYNAAKRTLAACYAGWFRTLEGTQCCGTRGGTHAGEFGTLSHIFRRFATLAPKLPCPWPCGQTNVRSDVTIIPRFAGG